MVLFHSYVKSPEGNYIQLHSNSPTFNPETRMFSSIFGANLRFIGAESPPLQYHLESISSLQHGRRRSLRHIGVHLLQAHLADDLVGRVSLPAEERRGFLWWRKWLTIWNHSPEQTGEVSTGIIFQYISIYFNIIYFISVLQVTVLQ